MFQRRRFFAPLLPFAAFALASCIGIGADIELKSDLSGTIAMEYRVSRMVESMGKVDGNDRWLPLPVSRADFERTVARVPALALNSWSSSQDETDLVVRAELSFSNADALVTFLDATGRSAKFADNAGERSLILRLSEGGGALDPDLETLVRTVFKGYSVRIRIKTPTEPVSSPAGTSNPSARTASFDSPVADLLASGQNLDWTVTWKE
ncbi:MAG: hypothetical protein A2Z99_17650 [Treponema sp. GWB1_62_6]|nr:MAG: hypothetical protein A2001_00895 [Treponema sp. GWC1_61_84]OHE65125.1 MAG: hypothetical protein A2Y36_18885 [Treponema sp. GWA1_62_8]OHE68688.1 MAG: hypothetical protein A2413_09335 [Treponema sp. RIFOXYC1_FULL_61_9]OHE72191.1 MAG: hypothetical protein A2Z99_17650 [Treponema sp. GWB1_62_6]HCM28001.1 hypothetical protein [Treponema sp.]